MFEFQGWATIREHYREDMEEAEVSEVLIERKNAFRSHMEMLKAADHSNVHFFAEFQNGSYRVLLSGVKNRRTSIFDEYLELYRLLAEAMPGSYGELSFIDEDNEEAGVLVEVYVLRKGTLERFINPFLSPFHPKVEELE